MDTYAEMADGDFKVIVETDDEAKWRGSIRLEIVYGEQKVDAVLPSEHVHTLVNMLLHAQSIAHAQNMSPPPRPVVEQVEGVPA